ncbi:MAG TPA: hypothetical protein VK548_20905 [Candidatus Acidoferrum sp.]|nr:hypothetical protein [Candidatus Acidoferrum sp.]
MSPVVFVALAIALVAPRAWAEEWQRLPAVVHVHSRLSTGEKSIDDLARIARGEGIGALFVVENYLLRVEYGLAPFRALTRVAHDEPSVMNAGLDRYRSEIARARLAHPEVVLVPGVEVIPHQHWSGSPLARSMMLHNTQKNLLVFGVTDPAALRSLPASGNPYARRYGWQSLVDALPALLVVPGVALLAAGRVRRVRVGRAIVVERRRPWLVGGILILIGAATVVRAWPFTVDAYPPWQDFGVAPHQALIDHVDRLGGVTVWSFPEAADEGRRSVAGVQVAWRTDPYPDDLMRTFKYTGFGAVYAQSTRFEQPGGRWDRLLTEYAAGERSRPAWGLGEAGLHALGGKPIGGIQTVFLVGEKTEAATLDALRRGRLYALQRLPEGALELADWSLAAGNARAVSGETLRVASGTEIEVRIAVDATGSGAGGLRVTLVRNGAVLDGWSGDASVRATYREVFDGRPVVFRIDARGRTPHRILSSPIFVSLP